MNYILEGFAREALKYDLAKLSAKHHDIFKRMYSHENLDADINTVIASMEVDKLDWALVQVRNSLKKLKS